MSWLLACRLVGVFLVAALVHNELTATLRYGGRIKSAAFALGCTLLALSWWWGAV